MATIVTATAWIGAGLSVAGYFTHDPVLSTVGGVMLGFASGYAAPIFSGMQFVGGDSAALSPQQLRP